MTPAEILLLISRAKVVYADHELFYMDGEIHRMAQAEVFTNEWIDVNDRLPEYDEGRVLVKGPTGVSVSWSYILQVQQEQMRDPRFKRPGEFKHTGYYATHWMRCPT